MLNDTREWHVLGFTGGTINAATDFSEHGLSRADLIDAVQRALRAGHDSIYLSSLRTDAP